MRVLLSFVIFLLSVYPSLGWCEDVALPTDPSKFHVFLLVGQSNMAGRGKLAEDDHEPNSRILAFSKAKRWTVAKHPLHFDKPIAGVGMGINFAKTILQDDPSIVVGLIPCAVGGSPVASWEPGAYYKQTRSHPYDDAIERAQLALKHGTLKGILWHQGESDAKPQLCDVYQQKLVGLINRLRQVLGSPKVPFLIGQLGKFEEVPWNDSRRKIDRVHQEMPSLVPHVAFVSSEGLTHKGDRVHFDSRSLLILGQRYAEAYLTLQKQAPERSRQ